MVLVTDTAQTRLAHLQPEVTEVIGPVAAILVARTVLVGDDTLTSRWCWRWWRRWHTAAPNTSKSTTTWCVLIAVTTQTRFAFSFDVFLFLETTVERSTVTAIGIAETQ